MGYYFDGYYVSRVGLAISLLMVLAAIVLGIIAVWSTGEVQGRLGGSAGILGSAGVCFLIPLSIWASETGKPYRYPKNDRSQF